jgi:hypothetical protein
MYAIADRTGGVRCMHRALMLSALEWTDHYQLPHWIRQGRHLRRRRLARGEGVLGRPLCAGPPPAIERGTSLSAPLLCECSVCDPAFEQDALGTFPLNIFIMIANPHNPYGDVLEDGGGGGGGLDAGRSNRMLRLLRMAKLAKLARMRKLARCIAAGPLQCARARAHVCRCR